MTTHEEALAEAAWWTSELSTPPEMSDWAHLTEGELADKLGISLGLPSVALRNALEKAAWWRALAYEVRDERRDAIARAEAAEAEAAEARAANGALAELAASETERRVALAERVAELEAALASADDETASASAQAVRFWRTNNKLAARVAELEAQVAAQSAQGWRDFTERPPIGEQIQITTVIDAVREEPDGLYRIGNTSEWQAWRPAPQEPTP